MNRFQNAFGALVLAQCAHSAEEYIGRLWESFLPARLVSGLLSDDPERGFIMANVSLVAFGLWCWLWPVRRGWRAALPLAWAWATLEAMNGIGHILWTAAQRGYTPGWGPRRRFSFWRSIWRDSCRLKKHPCLEAPDTHGPLPGAAIAMKVDGRIRELGDWRGETLARMRALILEADPEMTEEWKWMGTPVWSHQGNVCTGEVYTKVKLGETVDPKAFKALVKAAVALNASPARKR